MNKRKIAIFGATGSIGKSTLKVLSQYQEPFDLVLVSGHKNVDEMVKIAKEHRPQHICMTDPKSADILQEKILKSMPHIHILSGEKALLQWAEKPYDWAMMAISGLFSALPIAFALVEHTHMVALANKESIVAAGELLMEKARQHKTTILPVDSEHNAIFQALHDASPEDIAGITITASGGACRDIPLDRLSTVDAAFVLHHPVWQMGQKITVDSATMVNKGLEVMEASILFSLKEEQIKVLLHRDSIVHGVVDYVDGTSLAVMSNPDMQTAIAHSLSYPKRMQLSLPHYDFTAKPLVFSCPDKKRYPALSLARYALKTSIAMRIAYLVAAECATQAFLCEQIRFQEMTDLIEKIMKLLNNQQQHDINATKDICVILDYAKSVLYASEEFLSNSESLTHG